MSLSLALFCLRIKIDDTKWYCTTRPVQYRWALWALMALYKEEPHFIFQPLSSNMGRSACVMKYKWRYYDDSVSIPSYCGLAPDFWISKGNLPLIPSILKEGYMYIHNWLFLRILLATAAKVPPFFMFIWYLGKCITLITKPAKNHHRSKQLTPRTTESLR